MLIIPAIDIKEGKCVRLREGQFSETEIFSNDPITVAMRWVDKGAQLLHIVDLDGARYGKLTNISLLEQIIKKVNIPVQVGGGIRSYKEARKLIDLGASRIILGTILWENKSLRGVCSHKRVAECYPCRCPEICKGNGEIGG